MKYLGTITDNKDLVTKEYVDAHAGVAEDANGDISITRDIWAGRNIEADGAINSNGDITSASSISADGDIVSLNGDVIDGSNNILSEKITAPSSPSTGAFLVYDGANWVAQTLATWQASNY